MSTPETCWQNTESGIIGTFVQGGEKHLPGINSLPAMWQWVHKHNSHERNFNFLKRGLWQELSGDEFNHQLKCLTLALRKMGVGKGKGFGIIARPSPWWVMLDMAIMINGGISIPMFPNISPENFVFEVEDAQIDFIFMENDRMLSEEIREKIKTIPNLVAFSISRGDMDVSFLNDLIQAGEKELAQEPNLVEALISQIDGDDIATIIYTSGSTGLPKGAMITHNNFLSQIRAGMDRFPLDGKTDRCLTGLPLAHVFERLIIYFYISAGTQLYFADDTKRLGELLKSIQPHTITVVPRLLEKVYEKMRLNADNSPGIKGKLIHKAMDYALLHVPGTSSLKYKLFDKLVYSQMREALGGMLRLMVCGGARLNPDLQRFFLNIGIPLYEGYGLTEASPVLSVNFNNFNKGNSVGPVFPGVEVKIAANGEILSRGPHIMKGYLNNPQATEEAIDDEGWLHTGDKGEIHDGGFIRITGRIKELFKTSTGKYVVPVPIEQKLVDHELVDAAMIIADNQKYVTTLIFIPEENREEILNKWNVTTLDHEEIQNDPAIKTEIQALIQKVNRGLSQWEQIQDFRIIGKPLSINDGEMTPTMKIRRHIIMEKYQDIIQEMYPD